MELEADAALGENNAQGATDARNESQMRQLNKEIERDRKRERKTEMRAQTEAVHFGLPRGTKVE